MLKQVNGKWALVSRKTQRPLAYYKGEGKPSDEWVRKQEARIEYFKEATYVGNIGAMEMYKFHSTATPEQKKQLKSHIQNKRSKDAWKLVQSVTGVKLHKSIHEEKKVPNPDILPVSGGGQDGTDTLRSNYQRMTPGQPVKSFTNYIKDKK